MFAKNYYTLVAGFREYTLDADRKGFDPAAIRDEVLEQLTKADRREAELLYGYYDCENLAAQRAGRTAHSALGNLTAEEIASELRNPARLPEELAAVVRAYADPEGEDAERIDTTVRFETALFGAYYARCARSRSRFLRDWSAFDRTLRNLTAAVTARALGRPVEEATVGGGEIVGQLRRSSASDFGLRGELPWLDTLLTAVGEEQNLLEKEHRIDLVRWNEAEELSAFDYFDLDAVIAYLVRINIVARWSALDPTRGRALFERLMAGLDGKDLINIQ